MSKEVKGIFKALVGTIVIIGLLSFFVEILNISIYGIQLQQITRMACRKSLDLFTQETYKLRIESGSLLNGGSVNMQDVVDATGASYATGEFYVGTTVEEIYRSLYDKTYNDDFSNWVNERKADGNWRAVNLIDQYLNGYFPITTIPSIDSYAISGGTDINYTRFEQDMRSFATYNQAKNLVDTYATPINIGVPYIDIDTANKMFQWNLSRLVSNCQSDVIRQDESGTPCIEMNGFRVYGNQARITNIDYRIFNVKDPYERAEFIKNTNINPDNLKLREDITYLGDGTDERDRLCIIGVEYSVPITYIGITPIKHIFDFFADSANRVEGWQGRAQNTTATQTYNYTTGNMTGGGFAGNTTGALPVSSRLIYYIVR